MFIELVFSSSCRFQWVPTTLVGSQWFLNFLQVWLLIMTVDGQNWNCSSILAQTSLNFDIMHKTYPYANEQKYVGPTLGQCNCWRLANVSSTLFYGWSPYIEPTIFQWAKICLANVTDYIGPTLASNIGPMLLITLGQRWPNVTAEGRPKLTQHCFMVGAHTLSKPYANEQRDFEPTSGQCSCLGWANVGPTYACYLRNFSEILSGSCKHAVFIWKNRLGHMQPWAESHWSTALPTSDPLQSHSACGCYITGYVLGHTSISQAPSLTLIPLPRGIVL